MNASHRQSLAFQQRGLSLIELMISLTLSMVLILGVIQIFNSSKQTSRTQDALGRIQEDARFALDILSQDIRMAGQLGCNSNATINYAPEIINYGSRLFGYEYSDLPKKSALRKNDTWSNHNKIIENTDTLITLSASANNISPDSVEAGDPLVISDCNNADLFIADEDEVDITSKTTFSKQYATSAELARLNYTAYYVRKSGTINNLYRSKIGGAGILTTPLLEGIEDFQVEYGEDVNGNGSLIRYLDADAVDMTKVTAVRIHLLFSSIEKNLALSEQRYWFKGVLCTSDNDNCNYIANPDRKLYRALSTTIQLRNKRLNS